MAFEYTFITYKDLNSISLKYKTFIVKLAHSLMSFYNYTLFINKYRIIVQ